MKVCISIILLMINLSAWAESTTMAASPAKWTNYQAYVPEKYDYYFELGAMSERLPLYWMGAGFGRHLGTCVFSESQTCQQYWDVYGGAGGRDGLTSLMFMTGPRWQFVSFPKSYSPLFRIVGGVINIRDDRRNLEAFSYGIGYGVTVSVHPRVDLRAEARLGYADEMWTQGLVSAHVKMDRWVNYFTDKLKALGVGTLEATSGLIQKGFKESDADGRDDADGPKENGPKENDSEQ